MNSKLNIPARVTVFAVIALLVIAAALTLSKSSPGLVFALTSPPDAPTGLTATAVGLTAIELSWTAPSNDGGTKVTGYQIEKQQSDGSWSDTAATDGTGGIPNTEGADTQNNAATTLAPSGVQTFYSMIAAEDVKNSYRVRAINNAGMSGASAVASDTPPVAGAQPGAPTPVAATANGSAEINLTWNKVMAANQGSSPVTGYKIEYSKSGNLPWMLVADVGNVDRYSDTGLDAYSTRYYRVSAVNVAGRGPHSAASTENLRADQARTTPEGVPAAPTGLTVRATAVGATGVIELYWTAPTDGGGAPISGYRIERSVNGKTWTVTGGIANTEDQDPNSDTPGVQTYYSVAGDATNGNMFRVSAINVIETGVFSASASATIPVAGSQPGPPIDVQVASEDGLTPSSINLVWSAPQNPGSSDVTSYKIEYSKTGTGALPWMELATTSNTRYSNTSLPPATERHYRVSAVNGVGRGPVSTTLTAETLPGGSPPGAPTGLTATAVGRLTIELSWTAPGSTGGAPITGYVIEALGNHDNNDATDPTWSSTTTDGGVLDTEASGAQNEGPGVQTFYSMTADAAMTNTYRVRAINSSGTGAASAPASDTPPVAASQPDAPASTDVRATANGSAEINLTWTKLTVPAVGSSPVTGYKIEYSKNGSLPWMLVANVGNVDRYSDTGLDAYSTRYYRVSAVNSVGRGPVSTVDASIVPGAANTDYVARTTPEGVPAAPTGLTVRETTEDAQANRATIELYWTAPTDAGGAPISGYKIERSTNGKTWTEAVANTEASGGQNNAPDTSRPVGVQTYYSVAAAEAGNMFRLSAINVVSAINVIDSSTNPDQTGSGLFSDSASANIPVSGSQPDAPTGMSAVADGSSMINLVWTAPSNEGDSPITQYKVEYSKNGNLPWMELATTTTATAYTHTGLDPMTTRHYRVSAVNGIGRGPTSSTDPVGDPPTNRHEATTEMSTGDQRGEVALSTQAPMVGTAITATLTDADGTISARVWKWEKSRDTSSWMDATGAGATAATYTPATADAGYYLRATVTYTDAIGPNRMAYSDGTTGKVMLPPDRMGTVTLSRQNPVVGTAITASVTDPDGGVTNTVWQWATADVMDGTYTDIGGATSASYTPAEDDEGMYLQATATYDDARGTGKTVDSDAVMVMADVVGRYDNDNDEVISIDELFAAIDDYFADPAQLSLDELFDIIDAYFASA